MTSPPHVVRPVRAVLWDLDGTLYRQPPMRRRMLLELARAPLSEGTGVLRTLRRLKVFRRVREELRDLGCPDQPLERLQYEEPARRLGEDPAQVEGTVIEWMHRRPLRHLGGCRRPDLADILGEFATRGLRLGVFSDYPAPDKLAALGVSEPFTLTLCATDPEVNAFKPHPRGFKRACEVWDLEPAQVLYVGDREDVDGVGARAAGMPVCIVGAGNDPLEGVRHAALG